MVQEARLLLEVQEAHPKGEAAKLHGGEAEVLWYGGFFGERWPPLTWHGDRADVREGGIRGFEEESAVRGDSGVDYLRQAWWVLWSCGDVGGRGA